MTPFSICLFSNTPSSSDARFKENSLVNKEIAEMVLGWSASKVASAIEAGQNRPVTLNRKIPVHMTYFTMWPDDSGKLTSRADFYKRDSALKRALSVTRVALN